MNLFGSDGLRAGVIGAGSVAQTAHLPSYTNHPDTNLVAVADLDPKRRAQTVSEYDIDTGYESGETMLEEANIDIVSICTPAGTPYVLV